MRRSSDGGRFFVGLLMFVIFLQGLGLWIVASAITSGIKAASDSCGKRYVIEAVVGGDWFCPKE